MSTTLAPPPLRTTLADVDEYPQRTYFLSRPWVEWLNALVNFIKASAIVGSVTGSTPMAGALPLTTIPLQTDFSGLARVTWYLRITQAASANSSVSVTIQYTDGGVVRTLTGAALTTNVVTAFQSITTFVRCDPGTPVQYATSYSSQGSRPMLYTLDLIVEAMEAVS